MTERGTIDATLNEIAERSGVNSALIKYYFGNKDGLFLELLRYSIGKAIQDLEALVHMNL
ncbi:MAG: TetR family transcriptional regulator, partial [Verrucomicrobiales bacterium 32-60-5]